MTASTGSPGSTGTTGPEAGQEPVLPDPQAIATAVEACASVSRLSGGVSGEVATYLPGSRVNGVRVREDGIAVNVVAYWGLPAEQVGDEVRAAVRGAAVAAGPPAGPVDVTIDDLELPHELVERLGLTEPEPEPQEQTADAAPATPTVTVAATPPPIPGPSSAPAASRP